MDVLKRGVVKISDKQELLLVTDEVISDKIIVESIQEELEDHRISINENTNEIEANYEYIRALEKQIEVLTKKVEELSLKIEGKKEEKKFVFSPLSEREKSVFLVLYTQTQVQPFTSYDILAKKLNLPESLVSSYVTNMLEKGIPIVKKYSEGIVYLKLDEEFRELQAKKNIVGINTLLTYWL